MGIYAREVARRIEDGEEREMEAESAHAARRRSVITVEIPRWSSPDKGKGKKQIVELEEEDDEEEDENEDEDEGAAEVVDSEEQQESVEVGVEQGQNEERGSVLSELSESPNEEDAGGSGAGDAPGDGGDQDRVGDDGEDDNDDAVEEDVEEEMEDEEDEDEVRCFLSSLQVHGTHHVVSSPRTNASSKLSLQLGLSTKHSRKRDLPLCALLRHRNRLSLSRSLFFCAYS